MLRYTTYMKRLLLLFNFFWYHHCNNVPIKVCNLLLINGCCRIVRTIPNFYILQYKTKQKTPFPKKNHHHYSTNCTTWLTKTSGIDPHSNPHQLFSTSSTTTMVFSHKRFLQSGVPESLRRSGDIKARPS